MNSTVESYLEFIRPLIPTCRLLRLLRGLRSQTLHEDFPYCQGPMSTPPNMPWQSPSRSLLLLASGDVERNPGPLTVDDELEKIDDMVLNEDDYFTIYNCVSTLSSKWLDLCCALGLPPSLLSNIQSEGCGTEACLREGLINWLRRSYNIKKHGLPTWRKLVEAIHHPEGGNNQALASKVAEEHKKCDTLPMKQGSAVSDSSSTIDPAICSDSKKGQASTAFANMYCTISRILERSVDADELKEFLRFFCNPKFPQQHCVDPRAYVESTTTKDVLKCLCPQYINPAELFILEGIVETFGSRQCKKLLRDFQDKFFS